MSYIIYTYIIYTYDYSKWALGETVVYKNLIPNGIYNWDCQSKNTEPPTTKKVY